MTSQKEALVKLSTKFASLAGRSAIALAAVALLGTGCIPEHEHPDYKVNVQAVENATKKAEAAGSGANAAADKASAAAKQAEAAAAKAGEAAARAEAAAERAERAAAKAEAAFEKSMKK